MPYNANSPQPNDLISDSQNDILQNFQAINTLVTVNHENFASADQGKHKFVTFPVQASVPAANATEIVMYNKALDNPLVAAGTLPSNQPELFVKKTDGVNTRLIPFTASILSTTPSATFANEGWSYLPSGILLKWGFSDFGGAINGIKTVTFASGANIPPFKTLLHVQLTPSVANNNVNTTTPQLFSPATQFLAATFQVIARNSTDGTAPLIPTNIGFLWLAIGI